MPFASIALMDWKAFENAWSIAATTAIVSTVRANPDERFYAAAFHLFYSDRTKMLPVALALNTEAHVANADLTSAYGSTRWAPPEGRWDVLDGASESMCEHYAELSARTARDEWEAVEREHDAAIARVARRLTRAARERSDDFATIVLAETFVVAILDGQRSPEEYDELVR